ncbi:TRAP transporter small permease [Halalkalicoccus tibetensis]|uniref:TRAP transporter small permease n=1 Tax=Halalkalicoccus tibetensis TaxID=175632 RepID=A0ABD5V794_9EURY
MDIDQSLGLEKSSVFDRLVLYSGTLFFISTVVLASIQVFVRVIDFGIALRWTEALARFVLIVGTYFGAAVASRNREHIRIRFVLEKLEVKNHTAHLVLKIAIQLIIIVFVLVAVWATGAAAISNINTGLPGTTFVTSGMIYAGICIGFLCMGAYEISITRYDLEELVDNRSRTTKEVKDD